jgi:hydroxymethylpyrimidine/phosphomethylpyrimidine kinase
MTVPVVATVGTTHPLAFAGLVFAALALADDDARPVCVVAGVSAQSAAGVLAVRGVEPDLIAAQFAALADAGVAAFHVGALVSAGAVRAVADGLAAFPGVPVVVDPVLAASTGDRLGEPGVRDALRDALFRRATLVTPNLDEAGALLGRPVRDAATMHEAASALLTYGPGAVLVKGGHLEGDAIDILADASGVRSFVTARIALTMRGTGDLLATTIAAGLARGLPLASAILRARARVARALADGVPFAGTRVASLGTDASVRRE